MSDLEKQISTLLARGDESHSRCRECGIAIPWSSKKLCSLCEASYRSIHGGKKPKRSLVLQSTWSLHPDEAKRLSVAMTQAEKSDDPHKVDAVLDDLNRALHGHGVEAIHGSQWDRYYMDVVLLYVNKGDPYVATVYYDPQDNKFRIGGWGDWVEKYGDKAGVQ